MTIIKLQNTPGGGLLVYAPVAPTGECMAKVRNLEAEHGPVRHIVLGTLGLEHKVFAGPFAQRFKEAQVWFTPGQYRHVPLMARGDVASRRGKGVCVCV